MSELPKNIREHWIIRVKDGENFRNSKYPFWGLKKGKTGFMKTIVKKFKKGDIIWFMTSKIYGGKLIGMCEYIDFFDRNDEPLIKFKTISNEEQNWKGDEPWDLQLNYCNLYITEKQNIKAHIQCAASIIKYDNFIDSVEGNLYKHYKNFKLYAEPKIF